MDTSPKYIKMCEKAEEIQGRWHITRPTEGDYIFFNDYRQYEIPVAVLNYHDCCCGDKCQDPIWNYKLDNLIWLPRQDQLQEMMNFMGAVIPSFALYHFCMENDFNYDLFYSEEQRWLEFVMQTKFNKTWNGEEWV